MNTLAALHVAKKQLGLDDETYRAMLVRVTGKVSAKDMDEAERSRVVAELREKGFKLASNGARKKLEGKFAAKLQALWIAGWNLGVVRERDDQALIRFVQRQTGIDHVRFLRDGEDAQKAIEALKAWLAREGGVDWSQGDHLPRWLRKSGAKIAMAQWQLLARAGEVSASFDEFRTYVADHAARQLGDMSPVEWRLVMNSLGERVRWVKR